MYDAYVKKCNGRVMMKTRWYGWYKLWSQLSAVNEGCKAWLVSEDPPVWAQSAPLQKAEEIIRLLRTHLPVGSTIQLQSNGRLREVMEVTEGTTWKRRPDLEIEYVDWKPCRRRQPAPQPAQPAKMPAARANRTAALCHEATEAVAKIEACAAELRRLGGGGREELAKGLAQMMVGGAKRIWPDVLDQFTDRLTKPSPGNLRKAGCLAWDESDFEPLRIEDEPEQPQPKEASHVPF